MVTPTKFENFWRVSRNLKHGLVYEWDIKTIDHMFNSDDAIKWYKDILPFAKPPTSDLSPEIIWHTSEIRVFGKVIKHKLPQLTINQTMIEQMDLIELTKDFYSYIIKYAKRRMLSDTVLGVRQQVMKTHKLYLYKGIPVWFQLTNETLILTDSLNLNDHAAQLAQTAIILMKEQLDGFYMIKDYKLATSAPGSKEQIDFPLKHDILLTHPITGDPMTIMNNYTAWLRYAIFSDASKLQGRDPGDPDSSIQRPLLQRRQYDVIKRMGKRTIFMCPRRVGKTLLMTFLALRAVMKHNPKAQFRPTSVLYVGLSEKNLQPVLHYIKKMIQSFGPVGEQMFHYDSKFSILSFKQGKEILWTITFISCEWRNPGIGYFADDILIDECVLVPGDIFKWLEPIITHEWASLIACSTMYEDVKKGRSFDLLAEYEKESLEFYDIDKLILDHYENKLPFNYNVGLRYTIDDAEFIPPEEVAKIKAQYILNPRRYLTELYSRFPDEWKIFKYESSIREHDQLNINNYKYAVYAYDPARTGDKSAWLVITYNEHLNKICIIEEETLNKKDNSDYPAQAKQIQTSMKNAQRLVLNPNDVMFAMDWSQKWTADLMEMAGLVVNLRIVYHWGINISKSSIWNEIRVPKKYLINIAQILFDNDKIMLSNSTKQLQKQMDSFYEIFNQETATITYSGIEGENDDHVNAMFVGLYYLYEHMWLKQILIPQQSREEITNPNPTKDELRKFNKNKEEIKKDKEIKKDNASYWQQFNW